ncbi:MAG: class I adenylate-forming enzyme family protein [Marivita sp.]|uniref:class I adenylate-forming enzyme family protein n=1 Tax=Marivita sp. TaxID=2003365 RepID=UPI003EF0B710
MNICDYLVKHIKQRPDAPAIFSTSGDLTYAELGARVANLSAGLENEGVRFGDIVGVQINDALNHWVATLAIAHMGGTVVSVPRSTADAQRDHIFRLTGCTKTLSCNEYKSHDAPAGTIDIKLSAIQTTQSKDVLFPIDVPEKHPWIFANSSGSTGQPKIIPISHSLEMRHTGSWKESFGLKHGTNVHSMISINFFLGKRTAFANLFAGGSSYISNMTFSDLQSTIEAEKLHILYATPYHMERILEKIGDVDEPIFSKLEALYLGSATISPDLRERIRDKITKNVNIYYGANECGLVTISHPKDVTKNPKSIGHLFHDSRVEIVAVDGSPIPTSKPGLMRIKTSGLIDGYHGDPETTRKAFRDGWYYPGDVGYFMPDGQLVHLGRADNMMIVSGVNLYPAEIEGCLREVPGVIDVAVRALPHKLVQDLPFALVIADPSVGLLAKDLLQKVHKEIGKYALYDIEFIERMPINEQGKLTLNAFAKVFEKKWARMKSNP